MAENKTAAPSQERNPRNRSRNALTFPSEAPRIEIALQVFTAPALRILERFAQDLDTSMTIIQKRHGNRLEASSLQAIEELVIREYHEMHESLRKSFADFQQKMGKVQMATYSGDGKRSFLMGSSLTKHYLDCIVLFDRFVMYLDSLHLNGKVSTQDRNKIIGEYTTFFTKMRHKLGGFVAQAGKQADKDVQARRQAREAARKPAQPAQEVSVEAAAAPESDAPVEAAAEAEGAPAQEETAVAEASEESTAAEMAPAV